MVADFEAGTLLLELRHEEDRENGFAAINLQTGQVVWDNLQFEENWWTHLADAVNGTAYFFEYTDAQVPEPSGIIALDVPSCELKWYREELQLEKAVPDVVLAFELRENDKVFSLLHPQTGEELPASQQKIEQIMRAPVQTVQTPLAYLPGTDFFNTVARFIKTRCDLQAVGKIDYLEVQNHIAIACYQQQKQFLRHHLFVFSKDGVQEFAEVPDAHTNGLGLESFFCTHGQLFFIKEKKQLCSLKL